MNTIGITTSDAPSPFKRWLDKNGLTWYAVHRRTGLARSTCHDLWRGLHQPAPKSLKRIADAYDLSYESLAAVIPTVDPRSKLVPHPNPNRACCETCKRYFNKAINPRSR
jgi:transcriptional regulator with XRE-family HTH domain